MYETKTLDVLEFDKIKSFVASETISDLGREKVSKMSPATDFETVEFQMNGQMKFHKFITNIVYQV